MLYVYIFRKNIRRILFYNISPSVQYMQIGYQFHFKQIIIKIWLYYEDTRNSPVETGLFFCNSRYYNPEWGCFLQVSDISALNPSSINGLNFYAYADNNPVGIAYSSFSYGRSSSAGTMVNSTVLGGIKGGSATGISGLSISFSSQNWVSLGIDFTAGMSGALCVLG